MAAHTGNPLIRRLVAAAGTAVAIAASGSAAAADPRVGGDIGVRYDSLGGAGGLLGEPVTTEVRTPNGRGAYVAFQRGSIYWSPSSGAWETHGAIRDAWARTGWEAGPLGFPLTDEVRTPNGQGAYNAFQGGNVYWSARTGAHEVRGDILRAYAWAGWEGALGFPLTGEVLTPAGDGAYSVFEHGSIYWSPWAGPGAHVVRGAIRDAWAAQGWEHSRLGYPTSSEFTIPGGKRQNFEHGFIEWSPATGARVNQTLVDPGVAGCPNFPVGAGPEQAARCVVKTWQLERWDVMSAYAVNAVVTELSGIGRPDGRVVEEQCERHSQYPITESNIGVECYAYFDDPSWVHGWALHMGIDQFGPGAAVGDIDSVG